MRDVELDLVGPAGLTVTADVGDFSDVALRARVALRLPAGPATDAPVGLSGALLDVGGLVVVGVVNLFALPVSVPLGLLTNGDLFVHDVPRFSERMFSDVVFEETLWQQEVERRAAPHAAVLQHEADRQARFAPFLKRLQEQTRAAPGCILDDTGHCRLHFAWPTRAVSLTASGLACAVPPAVTTSDADAHAPPAPRVTFVLPTLPSAPAPTLLALPHNPDEQRGRGAERTSSRWTSPWDVRVAQANVVYERARQRGAKGVVLDDVDLVCRVKARGDDFDLDGSAPELSIRLAWGFDTDVRIAHGDLWRARRNARPWRSRKAVHRRHRRPCR